MQISPARNWCFTYNNHTSEIFSSISSKCSSICDRYVFQEEKGQSGTIHLQGYMRFKRKCRPFTHFKDRNFHWEITRSPEASITYCSSEDKRLPGGKIVSFGIPKLELVNVKTIKPEHFYEWQTQVWELLDNQQERSILWVFEAKGNTGKSSLVKYLCVHKHAIILSGKASDIKYGVVKYFELNKRYPTLITIDVPRTRKEFLQYSAIEELKNGCFFSGKYEGGMCIFNCPKIVCFSNSLPDLKAMSRDRWQIYNIVDKKLIKVNVFTGVCS